MGTNIPVNSTWKKHLRVVLWLWVAVWLVMCFIQFSWFHFTHVTHGVIKPILYQLSDTTTTYLRQTKEMKEWFNFVHGRVTAYALVASQWGRASWHGGGCPFAPEWWGSKGRKEEFGVPTIPSRPHHQCLSLLPLCLTSITSLQYAG